MLELGLALDVVFAVGSMLAISVGWVEIVIGGEVLQRRGGCSAGVNG